MGMGVWCPQRNRDRWTRSLRGSCSSACVLMCRGMVPSMVFTGKVQSVLLV